MESVLRSFQRYRFWRRERSGGSATVVLFRHGAFRFGRIGNGEHPRWFSRSDLRALAKELRRSPDPVLVSIPAASGLLEEITVPWTREHPREPLRIAEERAVLKELRVRISETLRRRGILPDASAQMEIAIRHMTIDDRLVLNPIGFPGRTLRISAAAIVLSSDAAAFVSTVREFAGGTAVRPCLRDDAVIALLRKVSSPNARGSEHALIVIDEGATSVIVFDRGAIVKRTVVAIDRESALRPIVRAFALPSEDDAEELLTRAFAQPRRSRLRRSVEDALGTFRRLWVQALEDALDHPAFPAAGAGAVISAVAIGELPPPLRQLLAPRVFRTLTPRFASVTVRVYGLPELLGAPETIGSDDAIALATFSAFRNVRTLPSVSV